MLERALRWIAVAAVLPGLACSGSGIDTLPGCLVAVEGTCTLESDRTTAEVCDRVSMAPASTDGGWTPGASTCDPGALSDAARDEALARANLYRWLTRVPPAARVQGNDEGAQACAMIQVHANALSHTPPSDAACFTATGADASKRSNLQRSHAEGSAATGVDDFISDFGPNNEEMLGHRRWVLHPSTTRVGFGFARADDIAATCMLVVDDDNKPWETPVSTSAPSAWPPPGPTPLALVAGMRWSVTAEGLRPLSVSVFRETDTGLVEVAIDWGWLDSLLEPGVWIALDEPAQAGTYVVEAGDLGYRVELVTCE